MPEVTERKTALKRVKTYLTSAIGNNRLNALMLVYVYNNVLNNINLADVPNEFADRKDRRKQLFGHLSQNYLL